jgi:hypothetical protein
MSAVLPKVSHVAAVECAPLSGAASFPEAIKASRERQGAEDAIRYSACVSPSRAHALTRAVRHSTGAPSSKSSETGGLANCSRLRTKTVH